MTDGNDSAFVVRQNDNEVIRDYGLTKREYFAAMAMQAIVSSIDSEDNYQRLKVIANAQDMKVSNWIAKDAVKQADALINELNK